MTTLQNHLEKQTLPLWSSSPKLKHNYITLLELLPQSIGPNGNPIIMS